MYRLLLAIFKWLSPFPRFQYFALRRINTRFMVGVVALICDDRDRVVLFHHTYRNKYAWGLPGGWLKRGEQPAEAVVREVAEESGLQIAVEEPLLTFSDNAGPMVEIVLKARLVGGEFRASDEVDRISFFESDPLPDQMRQTQKRIVQDFFAGKYR